MDRIPHTTPVSWSATEGRFASSIQTDSHDDCVVCLIGLPDDLGVRLNNGREGTAMGPGAIRGALSRSGTTFDALRGRPLATRVYDAGDVQPVEGSDARALERTHDRVAEALRAIHEIGMVPICLGGGHDLTLASVRALSQHSQAPLGGINLDAHLDVRETPGSGMPFRSLIESGCLDPMRHTTLGVGRFANAREHLEWLESQGGSVVPVESVLTHTSGTIKEAMGRMSSGNAPDAPCFVTFDLDAIDSSQAPGVSASNPMGVRVEHAMELARRASRDPRVRHLDIMELNPRFDVDDRTARLAALLVLTIVSGIEDRYT
ncbi:MAG: formimidoylglutamase [Phycisphaerales bacterium JB043]